MLKYYISELVAYLRSLNLKSTLSIMEMLLMLVNPRSSQYIVNLCNMNDRSLNIIIHKKELVNAMKLDPITVLKVPLYLNEKLECSEVLSYLIKKLMYSSSISHVATLLRIVKLVEMFNSKALEYDLNNNVLRVRYKNKKLSFVFDPSMPETIDPIYGTFFKDSYSEVLNIVDIKGLTIVDIGAFIGGSTIYFIVNGANHVYSYEPFSKVYEILKKNIMLNNLERYVTPFRLAVGGKKDSSIIVVDKLFGTNYSRTLPGDGIKLYNTLVEDVEMVPLEDVIINNDADIVHMNCEGCEYESILLADDSIISKPKAYIMQIHEPPVSRWSRDNILRKLRRAGFNIKRLRRDFYVAIH